MSGAPAHKVHFVAGMTRELSSLYLYTHLVEDRLVGVFLIALLHSSNNNEIFSTMGGKLHHLPVYCWSIDTVRVEIKTDQNKHILFCFRKLIIKQHLQPWETLIF